MGWIREKSGCRELIRFAERGDIHPGTAFGGTKFEGKESFPQDVAETL
jgi:hypothetical protein